MTTKKFTGPRVGKKLKLNIPNPTGLRTEIAELRREQASDRTRIEVLEKKVEKLTVHVDEMD